LERDTEQLKFLNQELGDQARLSKYIILLFVGDASHRDKWQNSAFHHRAKTGDNASRVTFRPGSAHETAPAIGIATQRKPESYAFKALQYREALS
jgi:hypothetical protein